MFAALKTSLRRVKVPTANYEPPELWRYSFYSENRIN
jgi:hypothetical protein